MKGSRVVLALAALVLMLGSACLWAQDQNSVSVDKVLAAGRITVRFDTRVYSFTAETSLSVRFEKLDVAHVKLTVKPINTAKPVVQATVQWDSFPPVGLELEASVPNSFILNTETGYAEK
jgi:hypothetical protein